MSSSPAEEFHSGRVDLLADEQIDWTNGEANGETLWALTDHLGTVRDLVNDAGVVQNHKSYDAFGNVTAETNAAKDAVFGFTGKLFDDATDLQNNLYRWYDAPVGGWMSEDPIGFAGGDANLNRYVGNMPTMFVDPLGLIGLVEPLPVTDPYPGDDPGSGSGPGFFAPGQPGAFYWHFLTPGNSAPADPGWMNWGSEAGFCVSGLAGGGATLGTELTITGGGCFKIYCRTIQTGIRRDPAHHLKPHGHWHFPWNW